MILESSYSYWDLAGVDGLQVAQRFGPVDRIAPFQSLETQVMGQPCSILRLCEANFRIGWSGTPEQLAALLEPVQDQRFWLKRFDWLAALLVPLELDWSNLATAKPPHRLAGLADHCAASARIDGIGVLIWRHPIREQPACELHLARTHRDLIQQRLTAALNQSPDHSAAPYNLIGPIQSTP